MPAPQLVHAAPRAPHAVSNTPNRQLPSEQQPAQFDALQLPVAPPLAPPPVPAVPPAALPPEPLNTWVTHWPTEQICPDTMQFVHNWPPEPQVAGSAPSAHCPSSVQQPVQFRGPHAPACTVISQPASASPASTVINRKFVVMLMVGTSARNSLRRRPCQSRLSRHNPRPESEGQRSRQAPSSLRQTSTSSSSMVAPTA